MGQRGSDRLALRNEAQAQLAKPAEVLFHDELGDIYELQLFRDVVAAARAQGLDYVCDAHGALLTEALFPRRAVRGGAQMDGRRLDRLRADRRFHRSQALPAQPVHALRRDDRPPLRARATGRGLYVDAELTRAAPTQDRAHAFRTAAGGEVEIDDAALAEFLDELVADPTVPAASRPTRCRKIRRGADQARARRRRSVCARARCR